MRSLALAATLFVAGCSCGHARHAAAIRDGAGIIVDMAGVAQTRPLTPDETATMDAARDTLATHADALAQDAAE